MKKSIEKIKPQCIAIVDVLGFSEILKNEDENKTNISFQQAIKTINEMYKLNCLGSENIEIRYHTDDITLFIKDFNNGDYIRDGKSIVAMIFVLGLIQRIFVIKAHMLTRGTIMVRNLAIGDCIFGSGILDLNWFEKWINYPFISVENSLFEHIKESDNMELIWECYELIRSSLTKNGDMIDYLRMTGAIDFDKNELMKDHLDTLIEYCNRAKRIKDGKEFEKTKEKMRIIIQYHNDVCDYYKMNLRFPKNYEW